MYRLQVVLCAPPPKYNIHRIQRLQVRPAHAALRCFRCVHHALPCAISPLSHLVRTPYLGVPVLSRCVLKAWPSQYRWHIMPDFRSSYRVLRSPLPSDVWSRCELRSYECARSGRFDCAEVYSSLASSCISLTLPALAVGAAQWLLFTSCLSDEHSILLLRYCAVHTRPLLFNILKINSTEL